MKRIAAYLYKHPALLFIVFTMTAFLPALLPFFYIKNDLVTQILPTRFVISESLHSGFSPWWNPYINYGIPQYSDMNCGFWNPILWIIAFFFRYNIWVITYEELFYIFLSGWGMFLVLNELGVSKKIAILLGFSYLCSGYIVGHMQHFCWITGAAFLPFVFLFFVRLNKNPSFRNFVAGSVFSFLFLSSSHPGIIIGALYFFFFCFLAALLFKNSFLRGIIHPSVIKNNVLFLAMVLVVSVSVIMGYSEALPYITRGEKLLDKDTVSNATTLQSYISLLFPLVVHKSAFFNTDISMRNLYTGLLTLPGIYWFFKNPNRKIVFFTIFCLLFFILLSAGGPFKAIANKVIPLATFVRSPGEFSLFTVFIMIIAAAAGFQSLHVTKEKFILWMPPLKRLTLLFLSLLPLAVIVILVTRNSFLFANSGDFSQPVKEHIKNLVDHVSLWDMLWIQCSLSLVTLFFLVKCLIRPNKFGISLVISLNLIVICWLSLPFTGVGSKSKKEVDAMLSRAPRGIFNQDMRHVNNLSQIDSTYIAFTGMPYTYMKSMVTPQWSPYPIHLKNNAAYFNDSMTVPFINEQAFLFLSLDTTINSPVNNDLSVIDVRTTGPGYVKALIRNKQFNYLTLLQNDYLHWQVFIDGKKTNHFTGYRTFISTAIPKKTFEIEYRFSPGNIITAGWISLILLLASIIYLLIPGRKRTTARQDS